MDKLDFSSLQKAVASLRSSLLVVADESWFGQQSQEVRKTLIAGVVQNFEFVYELSVKMLRRQLELEADSPESVDHASFRSMLRTAAEKGLVNDVEAWISYRELRNITSHAYNEEKARLVCQHSAAFAKDADVLLQTLMARNNA